MRFQILIVDDQPDNRDIFKDVLEREGYSVFTAPNGSEALVRCVDSRPDMVLTDVAMPGMDGFELCRRIKAHTATAKIPVVLMSGVRNKQDEQAEGLDLGADDYLVKPFTAQLLIAKVKAVLRRFTSPKDLDEILRSEGLAIDVSARTVNQGKKRIALTRKEFDLLTTFLRKPKRVLSTRYLLETVWGYDTADYNDPHTVETHVSSLRRKLGTRLAKRIVSVPSLGYRLDS